MYTANSWKNQMKIGYTDWLRLLLSKSNALNG